jgi:hypothetical protein
LPIAWSLGGGMRKIHLLWHRTERLDVEADEATFEVVRPGTTGQAWHLRTEPLESAPGQASSTRSRCPRWNRCPSRKSGCKTATWSSTRIQPRVDALPCLAYFMTESSTRSSASSLAERSSGSRLLLLDSPWNKVVFLGRPALLASQC